MEQRERNVKPRQVRKLLYQFHIGSDSNLQHGIEHTIFIWQLLNFIQIQHCLRIQHEKFRDVQKKNVHRCAN